MLNKINERIKASEKKKKILMENSIQYFFHIYIRTTKVNVKLTMYVLYICVCECR